MKNIIAAFSVLILSLFLPGIVGATGTEDAASGRNVCDIVQAEVNDGVLELKIRTRGGEIRNVYIDTFEGSVIRGKNIPPRNIPVDRAIMIARTAVPGEVVEVEYERGVYEVRIRANAGGTKKLYVDAATGDLIRR